MPPIPALGKCKWDQVFKAKLGYSRQRRKGGREEGEKRKEGWILLVSFNILNLFYLYVNMCVIAHKGQKKVADHLELELQLILSCPTWVL